MEVGNELKNTEVTTLDQRKSNLLKDVYSRTSVANRQVCVCGDPVDTDVTDHSV